MSLLSRLVVAFLPNEKMLAPWKKSCDPAQSLPKFALHPVTTESITSSSATTHSVSVPYTPPPTHLPWPPAGAGGQPWKGQCGPSLLRGASPAEGTLHPALKSSSRSSALGDATGPGLARKTALKNQREKLEAAEGRLQAPGARAYLRTPGQAWVQAQTPTRPAHFAKHV